MLIGTYTQGPGGLKNLPGPNKGEGTWQPSMLIDIENKRRTEINLMNGKFVEYGRQAGMETPYNKTFWALVKALEPK